MMFPDIPGFARSNAALEPLLGAGAAMRLYAIGEAPQDVIKPYAVWQMVGGAPENILAGIPNMDTARIQVDAYADSATKARAIGLALRDAFEPHGYVTSYNFEAREPETRLFRFSFNVEFMTPREVL